MQCVDSLSSSNTPVVVRDEKSERIGSEIGADASTNDLLAKRVAKFAANNPWPADVSSIPDLNERYTRPLSRERTVAVLGGSSSQPQIEPFEPWARRFAEKVVAAGGNIVTGCGQNGIMGAAYEGAKTAAAKPAAGENLAILRVPAWGDEDIKNARAIGVAASEEKRVEKFCRVASTVVAFPGGAGTLIELTKILLMMAYPGPKSVLPERVVVVGGDSYWAGLRLQLNTMVEAGQLKQRVADRFRFVSSEDELGQAVSTSPTESSPAV